MTNPVKASALIALSVAIAAMGIYVAHADDKPGAAVIGFLLMLATVLFGVRTARNRLPTWARRSALAVGVVVAAFAAFLIHAATIAAPLFAQPPDVPSVSEPAPSPQWAAAVDRARPMVRAAIVDQNGYAIRDQLLALTVKDFTNRRAALALDLDQLPPVWHLRSVADV